MKSIINDKKQEIKVGDKVIRFDRSESWAIHTVKRINKNTVSLYSHLTYTKEVISNFIFIQFYSLAETGE